MAGTPTESETKLMGYMVGWMTGARGGYAAPDSATADFLKGYEDGRKARQDAYLTACNHYGAELSPLR